MTSQDIDANNIALQLRELIATNREQIAEMKALAAQIQKDNAEFREQIINEFIAFKEDARKEFDKVHAEISIMQSDIRVQNTRIDDLIHWNYWLIAFVVAFFTLPSIAEGLKSLLKALASVILAKFSGKQNNED